MKQKALKAIRQAHEALAALPKWLRVVALAIALLPGASLHFEVQRAELGAQQAVIVHERSKTAATANAADNEVFVTAMAGNASEAGRVSVILVTLGLCVAMLGSLLAVAMFTRPKGVPVALEKA